jgi:hypothetical protein
VQANEISEPAVRHLKTFMVLQYARTEAAVDQVRAFLEGASSVTLQGKTVEDRKKPDLSHGGLVRRSLKQFQWMLPYTRDLKFCIFKNRTPVPFITSDNPLIFTNRLYAQKMGRDDWGVANAGMLMFLPLSPRLVACCYDAGMYIVDHIKGFADVKKATDVLAFNEMQYTNADQNVYFPDPQSADRISQEFSEIWHLRPTEKVRIIEFEPAEIRNGKVIRYRRIEPGTEAPHTKEKLVLHQTPRPLLAHWPSGIPFRQKRVAYSDGSAIGYVRNPEWLKRSSRKRYEKSVLGAELAGHVED